MAINMPQQGRSPLENLIQLAQGVKTGKDLYDSFKASSKAAEQEALENDAASPLSQSIRKQISEATGQQVPETVSYREAVRTYGDAPSLNKEKRQQAYDLEKIAAQGEQSRRTALASTRKDRLPADKVLTVNQGNAIPKQLTEIGTTIDQNQDAFGPVIGMVSGLNPYDTRAKTIDAQLRASAQAFGRYMEGGVLRKEDEEKYRRMFPTLSDTPEVARNKLAIVNKLLVEKQQSDVSALQQQGYSVSGLQADLGTGEIPSVIRSNPRSAGVIPEAQAAGGMQFDAQDVQALQWAQANPQDMRAREIMRRLQAKGLK